MLEDSGVPKEQFEKVCILVDKLDKIGAAEVRENAAVHLNIRWKCGTPINTTSEDLPSKLWLSIAEEVSFEFVSSMVFPT